MDSMEKKRGFIISAIYYLLIAGTVYLTLRYAVFKVMPFLIGFLAATLVSPAVRMLSEKFGLKKRPAGILILLIFYTTIGMIATILIVRLTVAAGEFSKALPSIYTEKLEPALTIIFDHISGFIRRLDRIFGKDSEIISEDIGGLFGSIRNSLGSAVSGISVKLITRLSGIAASIPGIVVNILFAVISSFFFTADFEKILAHLKSKLPERTVERLTAIRSRSLKTVGRYIRSYALIMLITFAELSLGLILIGLKRPFAAAFGIAVFDILPVLGTGGILIPWALVKLIYGDITGFFGLLVIWGIISVVRNIIEPKIVGKQVGLHPLATLISMYVGTKLFGFVGLFVCPIALSVWVSLKNDNTDNPASDSA